MIHNGFSILRSRARVCFYHRMKRAFILSGFLLLGMGLCTGWANEAARLPELVVTARAWPEPTAYLPSLVSVWNPDEQRWGWAGGIADFAVGTPGVHRTGDGPWASDLSIRGLSGDRIVVTLDGARLVTANDLAARLSLIDTHAIDRVEVFKGPVSALYGSGSLGGMVNIVMASPVYSAEPTVRQRVRLAALHNPDGWMAHYGGTYQSPKYFSAAYLTARDAASYRDGDGNRVRNTQFADQALTLRSGWRWSAKADSEVLVQYHRADDVGIPGTGRAPLPGQADVTYDNAHRVLIGLQHRIHVDGAYWQTSRLNIYYQQIERDVRIDGFPGGPVRTINPVGRHDTVGARWLNQFEVGDHQIGAGLETWRRDLDSTRTRHLINGTVISERPLPAAHEWSYGAFVEDRWRMQPDFILTAGARWDGLRVENRSTPQWEADSVNDWNGNAHAGFRWNLTPQWAARSVVAAGYRAPSLEERYQFLVLGDGRTKLGNPDLDAEQSRFLESGIEWANTEWSVGLSGFVNAMRNRVGEEVVDAQTLRNASIDRARIQGVEAEARWHGMEDWRVEASVAYLRGDDRSAGEPLPDIAPLSAALGVYFRPDRAWSARARYAFSARQDRVPTGMLETPSSGRADIGLAYTVDCARARHVISLEILNVADTTWRDHLSTWRGAPHNEPGRSIQLAWQSQF